MAIRTALQTKHRLRSIAMIVVCLVLGLWGVYDYAVAIPKRERAFQRGQVCVAVGQALEAAPGTEQARTRVAEARTTVDASLNELMGPGLEAAGTPDPATVQQEIDRIAQSDDAGWMNVLLMFGQALKEAGTRTADSMPSSGFTAAYEAAQAGINQTGDITRPGKFDRMTQWAFILCLPFVPYMAWQLSRQASRVVELDDDGTIKADGQAWSRDEIADIDMSRWMAKSIAWVVHEDGRRIKLDDYIWKSTDRIVGTLASERYPAEWGEDARPIKAKQADEAEPEAEPEAGPEDASSPASGDGSDRGDEGEKPSGS